MYAINGFQNSGFAMTTQDHPQRSPVTSKAIRVWTKSQTREGTVIHLPVHLEPGHLQVLATPQQIRRTGGLPCGRHRTIDGCLILFQMLKPARP